MISGWIRVLRGWSGDDQWSSQGTQGRAQFYSVIKKRQEVSTKTERERSRVPGIIRYICIELYTQQLYFPISKNPMAMLSMSASTTWALLRFWLSFSMSRRHSFNISRMVWYCLEEGPKVFRAFSRLFDIYPFCYFLDLGVILGDIYTLRKLSL